MENAKTIIQTAVEDAIHDNGGIEAIQSIAREYRVFGFDRDVIKAVDILAQVYDAITDPNTCIEAEEAEFLKATAEFNEIVKNVHRDYILLCDKAEDIEIRPESWRYYGDLILAINRREQQERKTLVKALSSLSDNIEKGYTYTSTQADNISKMISRFNETAIALELLNEQFAKDVFAALNTLGIELAKAE